MAKIRENNAVNTAIDIMENDMQYQEDTMVGSFWYDTENNELFGVDQVPASSRSFFHSQQFGFDIRTGPVLHQTRWKKEAMKKRDNRFSGDYTQVPRGRVFEFKNTGFVVFTGSWINDYPEAKTEIIVDFSLPADTVFMYDEHWDIGHGWSEEY